MKFTYKSKAKLMLITITISILIAATSGCIHADSDSSVSDSGDNQINFVLNNGTLMIPLEGKTASIHGVFDPENVTEIPATAYFSGRIDDNNSVTVEGTINVDGNARNVSMSGTAEKVFSGWNVPEGAKPIKVKAGSTTVTRYEGATEKYTVSMNLQDESEEIVLSGMFYEDCHGGFLGTIEKDGKECIIGLIGNATDLYERVILVNSTEKNL